MTQYRTFTQAFKNLEARFRAMSKPVHTERWQGQKIDKRPDMVTHELLMESFTIDLGGIEDLDHWRKDIKPNLPWADNHLEERVSGAPLNPGVQWKYWPWADSADKHRDNQQIFNHTYMERLWPRFAGMLGRLEFRSDFTGLSSSLRPHIGIRQEYGDLSTLIDVLSFEPLTRQAVIPLYFPEDLLVEGRKPCTLLYQFIMRDDRLHIYYPLRSCDFVRHWADDCYLAVRLLLWVIDECRKNNPTVWDKIRPGTYTMHMTSLHIFANDAITLGVKR